MCSRQGVRGGVAGWGARVRGFLFLDTTKSVVASYAGTLRLQLGIRAAQPLDFVLQRLVGLERVEVPWGSSHEWHVIVSRLHALFSPEPKRHIRPLLPKDAAAEGGELLPLDRLMVHPGTVIIRVVGVGSGRGERRVRMRELGLSGRAQG